MIGTEFQTQDGPYLITALLGRGKSGYTYLLERQTDSGTDRRVLKLMHDEPAAYYSFEGDKVLGEVEAYHRLRAFPIAIPRLYEYDVDRRYLIKSYEEGRMGAALVADGLITDAIFAQLFGMAACLEPAGINIDYFPKNFVVNPAGSLVYIDYEVTPYSEAWNLAHWGIYYWLNQHGMARFLATGNAAYINEDLDAGIPIKAGFEDEVRRLLATFAEGFRQA